MSCRHLSGCLQAVTDSGVDTRIGTGSCHVQHLEAIRAIQAYLTAAAQEVQVLPLS